MEPTPNIALKVALVRTGKTQRAIAKRARIHEARLSAIANGRINPNGGEQKRIARAVGCEVYDLFPVAAPATEAPQL